MSTPIKLSGLTLCVFLISVMNSFSQEVSSIRISADEKFISWVRNRDSLMVAEVSSANIKFVTAGLSDNGTQRFMTWLPDKSNLIFEKHENLFLMDAQSGEMHAIQHDGKNRLNLFLWYLIGQTSLNEDVLYFSASEKNSSDANFQLRQLNLKAGTCRQLSKEEWNVGNVSVSHDGRWVAFAPYTYQGNQCQTVICLYDVETGRVVHRGEVLSDFITEFKWNAESTMLAANNDKGASRFFSRVGEKLVSGSNSIVPHRILDFTSNSSIVVSSGQNEILSLDLHSNQRSILFTKSRFLTKRGSKLYVATDSDGEVLIRRAELNATEDAEVVFRIPKSTPSPFKMRQFAFENGDGKMSSAFLLLPEKQNDKSPLVIIPYGGYSTPVINRAYFLHGNIYSLVRRGYALCFPNTRGINSDAQQENYGKLQLEDTELLVRQLVNSQHIDSSKIFLMGHSHGATMVYYYLTHSDVFAGGIAINGAADWIKQANLKSMAGIPFGMGGEPNQRRLEYEQASPLLHVAKLKKPMLIVAGKRDTQIPYDINGTAFYEKAKSLNKDVRFLPFEDEGHLIKATKNIDTFWAEVAKFFK